MPLPVYFLFYQQRADLKEALCVVNIFYIVKLVSFQRFIHKRINYTFTAKIKPTFYHHKVDYLPG